ncbi:MAG: transporter substrate-binding domain-containing protein [Nostocoides sp.]
MKKTTLRNVAALGLVSIVSMTACSPSPKPTANAATGNNVLQSVLERGKLRVADCLSFAPFGYTNEAGKPEGYDIDIANEMAKELGVDLEVVDTTSANRIPNLKTDKVDVVICNFTRNGERQKEIDFTDPYVVATQSLLVKSDSGINDVAGMTGKTVATVKGSTNGDAVTSVNPKAKVQQFDSASAAILAVQQGQADAMVEDSNYLAYQVKLDPKLKVTNDALVPLEYNAFGVKQGEQTWLNWLNGFLFRLNASGKNVELYEKWFGSKPRFPLNPTY